MTDIDTNAVIRPFDQSLPMGLLKAREAAMRLFRPMLADHDLSEQQWRVLRALAASQNPIDAGELAERTFVLAPSLSRILTGLDSRLLIDRRTDPDDLRRSLVALTATGKKLVGQIAPKSESLYSAIEDSFGHDRLQRLLGELHDLATLEIDGQQIDDGN